MMHHGIRSVSNIYTSGIYTYIHIHNGIKTHNQTNYSLYVFDFMSDGSVIDRRMD